MSRIKTEFSSDHFRDRRSYREGENPLTLALAFKTPNSFSQNKSLNYEPLSLEMVSRTKEKSQIQTIGLRNFQFLNEEPPIRADLLNLQCRNNAINPQKLAIGIEKDVIETVSDEIKEYSSLEFIFWKKSKRKVSRVQCQKSKLISAFVRSYLETNSASLTNTTVQDFTEKIIDTIRRFTSKTIVLSLEESDKLLNHFASILRPKDKNSARLATNPPESLEDELNRSEVHYVSDPCEKSLVSILLEDLCSYEFQPDRKEKQTAKLKHALNSLPIISASTRPYIAF